MIDRFEADTNDRKLVIFNIGGRTGVAWSDAWALAVDEAAGDAWRAPRPVLLAPPPFARPLVASPDPSVSSSGTGSSGRLLCDCQSKNFALTPRDNEGGGEYCSMRCTDDAPLTGGERLGASDASARLRGNITEHTRKSSSEATTLSEKEHQLCTYSATSATSLSNSELPLS